MSTEPNEHLGWMSGVNPSGDGFVQLTLNGKPIVQWTPAETRNFAMNLFEVAEAAESDSMVLHFLMKVINLSLPEATQVMVSFRKLRESRGGAGWTKPEEFRAAHSEEEFARLIKKTTEDDPGGS